MTETAPGYALSDGKPVPLPHLPGQVPNNALVPAIGQHTRALLAEAGMGVGAIDALLASKLAHQAGEER